MDRLNGKRKACLLAAIILSFSILVIFHLLMMQNPDLEEIEQGIKNHFNNWEDVPEEDWNCYNMSIMCKEYFEYTYHFPCVYVHGEMTKQLKTLRHTWLMVKINGQWREFESVALEFRDVSDNFELEYMTYDYGKS